jgi:serine/threonine protein phosphatase 1
MSQRHLAIGDIHGCFDALESLCQFVGLRDDDLIVTLGDYVDRGPDTRSVLDFLIELSQRYNVRPIRGNHEIMMLGAKHMGFESFQSWLMSGGDATLHSYGVRPDDEESLDAIPDEHWDFLDNKLLSFVETKHHFFVHANAYPEMRLQDQPEFMLYWEPVDDPPRHQSGKMMICGHASQKTGYPKVMDNAICIDTWACGKGWLSCLHVESGMVWQANQKRETRRFWLNENP